VTREAPSGWGPFRFAATPRAWLRRADGTTQEVFFADHWGWTADEAEAKARKTVDTWKAEVGAWKWRSRKAPPGRRPSRLRQNGRSARSGRALASVPAAAA
jgi:hypothetical protein